MYLTILPLIAIYLITEPTNCNKPCNATITSVASVRTQISTQFTITGKNFAPNKSIKITISNRPAPLSPDAWSCGAAANSNASGDFTATCEVGYLAGNDDGTRVPYFIATDGQCAGVKEVLSAYWFAR